MQLRSFNKTVYLYVNPDGTQFVDENLAKNKNKIADEQRPDGIEEFFFTVKTVEAKDSSLSVDASLRYYLDSRREDENVQARRVRQVESKRVPTELLPQTETEFTVVAASLVDWNLEDSDGNKLPMTPETLKMLQPGWLYLYIKDAFDDLNQVTPDLRRD